MHLFQEVLSIYEYLYRLRQLQFIFDGKIPIVVGTPIIKLKKIGRNELYICGSYKKYKFVMVVMWVSKVSTSQKRTLITE